MTGSFSPPTLTGSIKRITENYAFRIPVFDSPGWGRSVERNFDTIDAVIFAVSGFSNVTGIWDNSTEYKVGQRAVDASNNTIWQCFVEHMSAADGTFEEDREANPTYWQQFTSTAQFRGAWTTNTNYNANEYITDSGRFGVVVRQYTSGASYNDDVDAGNIVTLVDASTTTSVNDAINAATPADLADNDAFGFTDASDGGNLKKSLWSTIKSTLKTYFDTLYHIKGGDDVPVSDGGTGASNAADARANLGLTVGEHVQAFNAYLTGTTATFTSALLSKLNGIEAGAQVTSASHIGTAISSGGAKSDPVANDRIALLDSQADSTLKYSTITNLANRIRQLIGGKSIGEVFDYAGTTAPPGSLLCYGQAISRTTYAQLFSAIGTTYGNGDGSTTFNVPDCRGRTIIGKDNMGGTSANRVTNQSGGLDGDVLGNTGGSETHVLTVAQIPSHSHTVSSAGSRHGFNGRIPSAWYGADGDNSNENTARSRTSSNTGGGEAHNNIQPSIVLNKCIYTGVY